MKRASAFVLSVSVLVLLLASACNNSVEDMLGDYNGGFNTGYVTVSNRDTTQEVLEPGDEGFDQNTLLFSSYTVYDIGTLNLAAPESCKQYTWELTDPNSDSPNEAIEVTYFDGTTSRRRRTSDYVLYIPESGLEIGHTYYLTLTVTGKDGRVYSDLAQIFTVEFHIEVDS